MSEQPGVRARRQPERLHPGNHLKNLNNTFTNVLVVVAEEPESAESQNEREYSNLDFVSGEIFFKLRTSFTRCNICVCVCVFEYMYIYNMCVCVCVCIYIYIYVYIHIRVNKNKRVF